MMTVLLAGKMKPEFRIAVLTLSDASFTSEDHVKDRKSVAYIRLHPDQLYVKPLNGC